MHFAWKHGIRNNRLGINLPQNVMGKWGYMSAHKMSSNSGKTVNLVQMAYYSKLQGVSYWKLSIG